MAQPAALRSLLLLALVWRSAAQTLDAAYQANMIVWLAATDNYIPGTAPSNPTWTSKVGSALTVNFGSSGASVSLAVDQADPTGAAGNNQCPVTYVSGVYNVAAVTGASMIFPLYYNQLGKTALTFCSVSRYTTSNATGRIQQGIDANFRACSVPRRTALHSSVVLTACWASPQGYTGIALGLATSCTVAPAPRCFRTRRTLRSTPQGKWPGWSPARPMRQRLIPTN